jgi:hypothetical protein
MKIEVKGGGVRRDGVEIVHHVIDREGVHHVLSDTPLAPVVKGRINSALGIKAVYRERPALQSSEAPPPYDIAAGDKDPAFVAWFARNHTPTEFAGRYGHRGVARPV